MEEDRIELDNMEEESRAATRKEICDRADRLLEEQHDRMKFLRSQTLLVDVTLVKYTLIV